MAENKIEDLKIGPGEKKALSKFLNELKNSSGLKLSSYTLYGSAAGNNYNPDKSDMNVLVAAENISVPVLRELMPAISEARMSAISPFFMTAADMRAAADVFPVKFMSMRDRYIVLEGQDILASLKINKEHLRLRCEQEARNIHMRLTRFYVTNSGRGLIKSVAKMTGGFFETLRAALSIGSEKLIPAEEVFAAAEKRFGIAKLDLEKLKAAKHMNLSPGPDESETVFMIFLDAADKLTRQIDGM
jgi:hypothetical protein